MHYKVLIMLTVEYYGKRTSKVTFNYSCFFESYNMENARMFI